MAAVIVLLAVFSGALVAGQNTRCYDSLGCFHARQGMPVPQTPDHIAVTFELHRRGHSNAYVLQANNYASYLSSWTSHVDSSKPTKLIIHGFLDNGGKSWISDMTKELLLKGDFNVIVVNWGHGSTLPYEQAASNTYVVGAETVLLLKYLHDSHHLQYPDVHVIGHSLGAQTAGHIGHRLSAIGRITGLDPADPLFTGQSTDLRLDATDAAFVDVIHTDASKFTLVAGYGTKEAVGDIDFYPNGGETQPGCAENAVSGVIISAIQGQLSGATDAVACSHSRSRDLFKESIRSLCKFYGHKCPSADGFEAGSCLGCPAGGCPVMGYDADQFKNTHGTFYLSTSGAAPFCGHEYFVSVHLADRMFSTYGELMVTLVGSKATSEELKFESKMHQFRHSDTEQHVIATHSDLGTLTGVKVRFVRAHDAHSLLASHSIRIHSVSVTSAESNQKTSFCAHDDTLREKQTHTYSSHSGC